LNYLEREYILKEWKEWITSELANCERVKKLYNSTYPAIEGYCEDVEHEMSNLYETLL
jgi:predicted choloylglycine hydrolase